jgi:hypothetical protein
MLMGFRHMLLMTFRSLRFALTLRHLREIRLPYYSHWQVFAAPKAGDH